MIRIAATFSVIAVLALLPAAWAESEKKGPPFADKKKKEEQAPKPEVRSWTVVKESENGKLSFTFEMKPGVPDPDQVTEVTISASAIPKRPDPVYGNQVPLVGARIVLELTSPGGELVGRYLAHPVPMSKGRFALHLTPAQEGIYGLALKGKSAKGEELTADLKLPVKVWPLPEELQGAGAAAASASRKPLKL